MVDWILMILDDVSWLFGETGGVPFRSADLARTLACCAVLPHGGVPLAECVMFRTTDSSGTDPTVVPFEVKRVHPPVLGS